MSNDKVHFLATTTKAMLNANNGNVKFIHVLYNHKEGSWSVKIDHYKEAVFTSQDKAECIAEAKRLAQESTAPKRRVLVRGTSGGIVKRVDYPCVSGS
jgi:hypothetical protein